MCTSPSSRARLDAGEYGGLISHESAMRCAGRAAGAGGAGGVGAGVGTKTGGGGAGVGATVIVGGGCTGT
jgi:hypothetical protein